MNRLWIAVAALVVAIAVVWFMRRNASTDPSTGSGSGSAAAVRQGATPSGGDPGAADAPPKPGARVARLDREAHRQLVERIASARAARAARKAAAGSGSATAAPEAADTNDLARIGPQIKEGLEAAISFLADCYTAAGDARPPSKTAAVNMTLVGDPEIGMVIDADEMVDEAGAPLDPALDACLRTTLESLALPPLDTGDSVRLKYSFRFD